MNVQLKDITVTARDGRVSHLDQVYIRGSHVRFFIVPDMLRLVKPRWSSRADIHMFGAVHITVGKANVNCCRNAPMFRSRNTRGRGVGLARGRATVSRARASGRGAPRGWEVHIICERKNNFSNVGVWGKLMINCKASLGRRELQRLEYWGWPSAQAYIGEGFFLTGNWVRAEQLGAYIRSLKLIAIPLHIDVYPNEFVHICQRK